MALQTVLASALTLQTTDLQATSQQATDSEVVAHTTERLRLASDLESLMPGGHLRPGSTLEVAPGPGQVSVLLRLLSGPTSHGAWASAIGFADLNPHAALESGVALERFALIPDPGVAWLEVTAALLDTVELVVLNLSHDCRPSDARRLLARARQRRSVLILTSHNTRRGPRNRPPRRLWPEQPDVTLTPTGRTLNGLNKGHGRLHEIAITVSATGRRLNGPARSCHISVGEQIGQPP